METSQIPSELPEEALAASALAAVPDEANLVTARIDELIVGRTMRYPLYDPHGVLLLAEGVPFTEETRRILAGHNIHSVQLHADDFARMTFQGEAGSPALRPLLDDSVVKKLDEVVDSGLLFVVNSETALLDQITQHGAKTYDRRKYLDRIQRNKETSVFVDNLIRNAARGQSVDCGQIVRLTASYLNDITSDLDSTLASRIDTIRHSAVSDHCVAMAVLGMAIGVEMGLDARNVRTIALAGLLHDWGMIRVPQEIREATHRLTEAEYFEIVKHPIYTLRILDQMCGVPASVPLICYQVHERPNGEGYPQGRKGPRIHLMARILAVADAYNALISPRPYRPPLTPYAAMECLLRQAAVGDFDPQVVRAFLLVQSLFPIGSYLVLSDGTIARVLRRNGDNFLRPIVQLVQDAAGQPIPEDATGAVLDLAHCDLQVVQPLGTPGSQAVSLTPEILKFGCRSAGGNSGDVEPLGPSEMLSQMGLPSAQPIAPPPVEVVDLEAYTEKQRRLATCALEVLQGARSLTDRQYSRNRQHPRAMVQTVATVCLLDAESSLLDVRSGRVFRALIHDVSQGGLCFIHPAAIPPGRALVGLQLAGDNPTWFVAQIVRSREVGDTGFWEHGVALQQRAAV